MLKPLDGPGTKPVDEHYRTLHLPSDSRREIIERAMPDSIIHRDQMGSIVRVGGPITPPMRLRF